jgi:uncharacterized protein YkwD
MAALLVPATASAGLTRSEAALLNAMNRARATHGVAPLRADARLERAARSHSREMLVTGSFDHGAFVQRMLQFDVTAAIVGENLAWGSGARGTANGIVAAWLASPEHRANLLEGSFTRVGVGAIVGSFLGVSGARVVTADFSS